MACTSENTKLRYGVKQSLHTEWDGMPLENRLGSGLGFFYTRQKMCWIQTSALCLKIHVLLTVQIGPFICVLK